MFKDFRIHEAKPNKIYEEKDKHTIIVRYFKNPFSIIHGTNKERERWIIKLSAYLPQLTFIDHPTQ